MKKIYYEKKGRRYVPVAEYDSEYLDSFPKGNHLVMVYPGGSSRRFNIDPNYAAMIAAGRVAEDAISAAVVKASEMRPRNKPITEKQRKALENLAKAFGQERYCIELPSAREIAEEAVKAMQKEADKLLEHPAVIKAWNNFQLVCALTKETNSVNE
ncbi:MAG: hypothetical protein ACO3EE_11905 [Flavobacteriales bacterium]